MRPAILSLCLFIILVFEGVALELLPERIINANIIVVPHWILMFLIVFTMFYETKRVFLFVIYATAFGLLVDIVYTDIIGVYMFAYALSIYAVTLMTRLLQENVVMAVIMSTAALLITEGVISTIYTLLGITKVYWLDNLSMRLIPTIIANIVLLLIIYPLLKVVITRLNANQPN